MGFPSKVPGMEHVSHPPSFLLTLITKREKDKLILSSSLGGRPASLQGRDPHGPRGSKLPYGKSTVRLEFLTADEPWMWQAESGLLEIY